MSDEPPAPPESVSEEVVDALDGATPAQLRDLASYAEEMATQAERQDGSPNGTDDESDEERPDDLPDDVPAKATLTVKEINGNRYHYWQWRDGDRVRSRYKGPVGSES